MAVLQGADVVRAMNQGMQEELKTLPGPAPHLAIVRIGQREDDLAYERGAVKRMATVGLRCTVFPFDQDIGQAAFVQEFVKINENPDVDGILLLRPLPKQFEEKKILALIDPAKDVDGISPTNLSKVFAGDATGFAPCTAAAVLAALDFADVALEGRRVVIVGRSLVVGKPLAMLLLGRNATVTVCHSKTVDLPGICRQAEVLVAAVGAAKLLDESYIPQGGVVIDVGINVDEAGQLWGDVDFDQAEPMAGLITPVPGGIGTVTTSVLARHVIQAAKMQRLAKKR